MINNNCEMPIITDHTKLYFSQILQLATLLAVMTASTIFKTLSKFTQKRNCYL